MSGKRKTDKRKVAVAVLCIVLVLAMVVPTMLALLY